MKQGPSYGPANLGQADATEDGDPRGQERTRGAGSTGRRNNGQKRSRTAQNTPIQVNESVAVLRPFSRSRGLPPEHGSEGQNPNDLPTEGSKCFGARPRSPKGDPERSPEVPAVSVGPLLTESTRLMPASFSAMALLAHRTQQFIDGEQCHGDEECLRKEPHSRAFVRCLGEAMG